MRLNVNGEMKEFDVDPSTPLLWVLRDEAHLTGTKYGCGMALCGACTIYIDGEPTRSCVMPAAAAEGKKITTIEGLAGKEGKAVQDAWVKHSVPQCGYCQSGQIMAASALLKKKKNPTDADIDSAMSGNICRCGTYQRMREAIHDAARSLGGK